EVTTTRLPMQVRAKTIRSDEDRLTRLDALDSVEETGTAKFRHQRQKFADASFIRRIRHFFQCVQPFRHAREREESVAALVMQRQLPRWITRKQQAMTLAIPKSECIVAYDMLKGCVVPTFDCGK